MNIKTKRAYQNKRTGSVAVVKSVVRRGGRWTDGRVTVVYLPSRQTYTTGRKEFLDSFQVV